MYTCTTSTCIQAPGSTSTCVQVLQVHTCIHVHVQIVYQHTYMYTSPTGTNTNCEFTHTVP